MRCKQGLQSFTGCGFLTPLKKSHSSITKTNTIPVNFSKITPQICSRQDFTFQSSHFCVPHFLFKLGLTGDSFIFIFIPGQETCLNYYQNMTVCITCLARTALELTWCSLCLEWSVSSRYALLWNWHGLPPFRDLLHPYWSGTNPSLHEPLLVRSASSERSQWISGPLDGKKQVRRVTCASSQMQTSIKKAPITIPLPLSGCKHFF